MRAMPGVPVLPNAGFSCPYSKMTGASIPCTSFAGAGFKTVDAGAIGKALFRAIYFRA